jgi:amino-acid N-acetyltransferase
MNPVLRAATSADLSSIESLLRESDLPTEGVADLVTKVPGAFVVAEWQGALVAAGAVEPAGGDGLLRSIVVRPDARAAGVGRQLVERLLGESDACGMPGVYLLTTTADRWFPRFGFQRTDRGTVPAAVAETWEFKTGCSQTAIAMCRKRAGTGGRATP